MALMTVKSGTKIEPIKSTVKRRIPKIKSSPRKEPSKKFDLTRMAVMP